MEGVWTGSLERGKVVFIVVRSSDLKTHWHIAVLETIINSRHFNNYWKSFRFTCKLWSWIKENMVWIMFVINNILLKKNPSNYFSSDVSHPIRMFLKLLTADPCLDPVRSFFMAPFRSADHKGYWVDRPLISIHDCWLVSFFSPDPNGFPDPSCISFTVLNQNARFLLGY